MNQDVAEFTVVAQALYDEDCQVAMPPAIGALGAELLGEFHRAELDRKETEDRWLQDLRQYKGQYDPEVAALIPANKSKAFVRKTRVKVKTTDSRVMDLLFPAGVDKNWGIDPTPKPSLSPDQRMEIRQLLLAITQGKAPTRQQFEEAVRQWAKERCKKMATVIDDQLAETRYKQVSLKAIHSGHLYGTGIVKGPLVERKVRTRFVNQAGRWVPQSESYVVPFVDFVPLWRFFPDMSATELEKCRYVYERHLMTGADMADLASRKSFNAERIKAYIKERPKGEVRLRSFDTELSSIGDREASMTDPGGRYEVLERWGWLTGEQLHMASVEVPEERRHESFFSNVWLLPNGEVIKAVLQPINGVTWPYHVYYFDKDESSIFGEGLASVMRDDQAMLNAATRLMIDNAAISASAQLEVNPHLLSNADKVNEITPWKVWLRNNTNPGTRAVNAIELPSRMPELANMAQMFENNADETTAIPRYMAGENVSNGAAGTSSGLSMLMGNVNIVLKDLVASWDQGVTVSFIRALYFWNMQFNPDDACKGDYDVVPKGVASLVAKEVRAQALDRFAVATANDLDAPFIKRDVLNRQRAEALELIDVVKTEEELQAEQESEQAKAMAKMQSDLAAAQLAEAQARAAKIMADAEVAKRKVDEMLANIELTIAKTVSEKVAAAYAALQAGGVATSTPYIAPAGDEILRSAGWTDATPKPSIADLNRQPVQDSAGTVQVLGKGQTFAEQPRGDGNDLMADPANTQQPGAQPVPNLQPQTGQIGEHAGIETAEVPQ